MKSPSANSKETLTLRAECYHVNVFSLNKMIIYHFFLLSGL